MLKTVTKFCDNAYKLYERVFRCVFSAVSSLNGQRLTFYSKRRVDFGIFL
nr:MAG TPA: hypothetical protein [Caudoviricetes sp.]